MRALTCSAQLCLSQLRAIAAKTLRLLATSVALVLAASCGRVGFSALQSSDANANADASVADASSDAGGWWNAAWQFRKKVRFRNAQRNEGFDGMPVAISLPPSIADVALPSLDDVRFIEADGSTELPYEIERSVSRAAPPLLWLRVPRIDAATDQDFVWLYYGNANPGGPGANPTAVWDSSYLLVQHFGAGSAASSSNVPLNLTVFNITRSDGLLAGDAALFDRNAYVRIDDNAALHPSAMTITAWARKDESQGMAAIVARSNAVVPTSNDVGLFLGNGECTIEYLRGTAPFNASIGCATDASLHMHALVIGPDATRAYSDGISLFDITSTDPLAQSERPITVGADINDGSTTPNVGFFQGLIDEVRIANVARTAAWLDAELAIGNGTFVVVE
ncbi:MAG TPA: DUF2341 domain-containing protein [Kofleriaceae bacterium]|nr:DUF2341 domain-containing protein [Kofleriaceae bacterium]